MQVSSSSGKAPTPTINGRSFQLLHLEPRSLTKVDGIEALTLESRLWNLEDEHGPNDGHHSFQSLLGLV